MDRFRAGQSENWISHALSSPVKKSTASPDDRVAKSCNSSTLHFPSRNKRSASEKNGARYWELPVHWAIGPVCSSRQNAHGILHGNPQPNSPLDWLQGGKKVQLYCALTHVASTKRDDSTAPTVDPPEGSFSPHDRVMTARLNRKEHR